MLVLYFVCQGGAWAKIADVEYICLIAEMMQKMSLSQSSFCSKSFDFALGKPFRFILLDFLTVLDYFL